MSDFITLLLVLTSFGVGLASVILSFIYATKATLNRKLGEPYFPGDGENPNNVLFRPSQLNEAGLKARKNCFRCLAMAFGAAVLWIVVALFR